ncbi:SDR family NAD(P)-dependent oxidoreductase [Antrihabitans stalagmiti]|uniref:SDR family NAD(P)-dependent oxidoreductase n=1 Tax=Antrihabitans stalagmiti TaxID=2799499 RepID=UPI0027DE5DA0|nr:SDR family oxidoreductase [Antrihabitans stalagmiti]
MSRPRAVITGVSSGIGAATARRLLDDGWLVTGLSRRKPEFEDATFSWIECDLSDLANLRHAVSDLGPIDAIVHAAGLQRSARLGDLSTTDSHAMWEVHVAAAEQLVDTLIDDVVDGGRIVLIGSRTMTGVAGKSQYTATKAAQFAMARSWALELMDRAITVNVVAPGPTSTPMLSDPARSATPPTMPPLGRFIEPEEIAGTVAFLLSPSARSITGQALVQCAGSSL